MTAITTEPVAGDCLIWIGRSYPTVQDFVAEARLLGCSRKVPCWPAWLRQGSRIFLAHHADAEGPAQGVVFGYYRLGGVDVILRRKDYERYRAASPAERVEFWEKTRPRGGLPEPAKLVAEFLLCCEKPPRGLRGLGCGFSEDPPSLVRARDCGDDGLRKPGEGGRPTFYLIDAMARAVMEEFCRRLKKVLTRRSVRDLRKEARKDRVKRNRQKGLPEFEAALQRVHARRAESPLVLFRQPYPIFEHAPHAYFRGITRIDGDELLARIRALRPGQRKIGMPYWERSALRLNIARSATAGREPARARTAPSRGRRTLPPPSRP